MIYFFPLTSDQVGMLSITFRYQLKNLNYTYVEKNFQLLECSETRFNGRMQIVYVFTRCTILI